MSRFLLNLRQVDRSTSTSGDDMNLSQFTTPAFVIPESRLIGNLGEDLEDIDTTPEDYDEEADGSEPRDDVHTPLDQSYGGFDVNRRLDLQQGEKGEGVSIVFIPQPKLRADAVYR